MTALASPMKIEDYKLCEQCGKYSPKGLRFDLDEPRKERKWRCDRCYWLKYK